MKPFSSAEITYMSVTSGNISLFLFPQSCRCLSAFSCRSHDLWWSFHPVIQTSTLMVLLCQTCCLIFSPALVRQAKMKRQTAVLLLVCSDIITVIKDSVWGAGLNPNSAPAVVLVREMLPSCVRCSKNYKACWNRRKSWFCLVCDRTSTLPEPSC